MRAVSIILQTTTAASLTFPLARPCRYNEAAIVFREQAKKKNNSTGEEAETAVQQQGQGHSLDTDAGLQDLLFYVAAEGNPQALVDSFDQLAAWADSSLDLYRVRPGPGVTRHVLQSKCNMV
jgi:hypothetical protein